MRGLFGLVGLLVSLAIVGLLVRKQMTVASPPAPVLHAPAVASSGSSESAASVPAASVPAASVPGNAAQQSQQAVQQVKQALEAAMQARPMPDDK